MSRGMNRMAIIAVFLLIMGTASMISIANQFEEASTASLADDTCLSFEYKLERGACVEYNYEEQCTTECSGAEVLGVCLGSTEESCESVATSCAEYENEEVRECTEYASGGGEDNEDEVTDVPDDEDTYGGIGSDTGGYYDGIKEDDEPSCEPERFSVCEVGERGTISNGEISGTRYKVVKQREADCDTRTVERVDCVRSKPHPHLCTDNGGTPTCTAYEYEVELKNFLGGIGLLG